MGLPHGDVVGFKDATTVSGLVMMSVLSQQPVPIAIEADQSFLNCTRQACLQQRADQSFFQWYKTGVLRVSVRNFFLYLHRTDVITAMCETERDHGILAVGYGGTDEWNAIFICEERGDVSSEYDGF